MVALGALSLDRSKAGMTGEASLYRKRADALFEELCRTRAGDPGAARARVEALLDRAAFLGEAGRSAESEPAYTKAVDEAIADFARELELLPEDRSSFTPPARGR